MRKIITLTILALLASSIIWAQSDLFNYQGIARNSSGNPLANQAISIRVNILKNSATGVLTFQETHAATTNSMGLYTLAIGSGTVVSGDIKTINWGDDKYFIKIEMDPAGGSSYASLGTQQLLSVPYAKQASALNIYQSGTSNPDKMIIAHSPAYQDWGVRYEDNYDRVDFIAGGTSIFRVNLGDNTITYSGTSPGDGKVLTSDASGNASWTNKNTKVTSITSPGCQSLSNVTTTMTKIADLGTFTKNSAGTFVDINLSTFFSISAFSAGATGAIFEVRIDNTSTTLGKAAYLLRTAGQYEYGNILGTFQGLSAGTHTISIWVRTSYSTGTSATYDAGCWGTFLGNSLIVKEYY